MTSTKRSSASTYWEGWVWVPNFTFTSRSRSRAPTSRASISASPPCTCRSIKGLGGNPVVIPPTEVYAALERNVVDGYCWPAVGIRDWGWQKQTKYIVDPGFYQVPNPLVMNLKTWNKLPKKLQDLLTRRRQKSEKKVVAHFDELAKTGTAHPPQGGHPGDRPAAGRKGKVPESGLRRRLEGHAREKVLKQVPN